MAPDRPETDRNVIWALRDYVTTVNRLIELGMPVPKEVINQVAANCVSY